MPLPHFLMLVILVLIAGALTLWGLAAAGVPLATIALGALVGAGVIGMMTRVE